MMVRRSDRGARGPFLLESAIVLGVLLPATFAARVAAAEPRAVNLEWIAPPECPAKAAILAQVDRILGPSAISNPQVSARASVERVDAATWKGAITIVTEDGTSVRSFVGSSCATVASAVSLIVAIAIGPSPGEPLSEAATTALAAPATAPPPAASAAPAGGAGESDRGTADEAGPAGNETSSPPDGTAREPRLTAAAFAAVDVGSLPAASVGARIALGWRRAIGPGHARLEAEAGAWGAQTARLGADPSEGAQLFLLTFGARACYGLAFGRLDLGPCAGVEVARLQASGFSAGKALDGTGVWASLRPGLHGSWSLSRTFAVRVGGDVEIPVSPPQLVVQTPNPGESLLLFRPAAVGLGAALGLEMRFL